MMNWFAISWGAFDNNSVLPFVIFSICLLIYRYYKKQSVIAILAGTHYSSLIKNVSRTKPIMQLFFMSVGLIFLFLSLLRPQWNKAQETVMHEGRDLYIALDISRSMLAADCEPNRLAWAKHKIKRLVSKLSCERVGLILFSGSAFVQCPLTADYSAFFSYLDAVDAEFISSGTTAIDQAIKQTLNSFASIPSRKNKLLVLFTDGEDFSHDLSGIKKEAAQAQLSIFTVGIGTHEGAPVPVIDQFGVQIGHQKDKSGNVVISRLNERMLHTLSRDAGGSYVCATKSDEDIISLIGAVQVFEKEQLGQTTVSKLEDQYHYFLLVSFVCFALDWLL